MWYVLSWLEDIWGACSSVRPGTSWVRSHGWRLEGSRTLKHPETPQGATLARLLDWSEPLRTRSPSPIRTPGGPEPTRWWWGGVWSPMVSPCLEQNRRALGLLRSGLQKDVAFPERLRLRRYMQVGGENGCSTRGRRAEMV